MANYNFKRRIILLITIILCFSLLSACRDNNVKQSASSSENSTNKNLKFKGGEKSPEEVRVKFLEAIENKDYKSFVDCIANEDITEAQFNAFLNQLALRDGSSQKTMETNLQGSVADWENAKLHNIEPSKENYFAIIESNNRYKIVISEGNVTFTDGLPDMTLTITETNQTFKANEFGETDVSIFPGEYNYTLFLETPDGIVEGNGKFDVAADSNIERSLARDYDSDDIPESTTKPLKKEPKVSNLFLGSWKSEDGKLEMHFANTYDYHHLEFDDHYENSGSGKVTIKVDGLSHHCDFEILSENKINIDLYGDVSTMEYYFDNGVLWMDGIMFIRQSN